jgi:hypothetical protein
LIAGLLTNGIAVVSFVSQQRPTWLQVGQKLLACRGVMRLSWCQSDPDRPPFGIDQGKDLGAQAATGTSHVTISTPFLPLAPC